MILWGIGSIQYRTTCRNSSPNSPNYVDWNTQTESNLKSCCNFIYYILKSANAQLQIELWCLHYRLISPHYIKRSCNSSVPSWSQEVMPTYLLQSIYFRQTHTIYKIMGWDTQKLALKNMKNIKYGTLSWLCPACQIELSIRSYQTELSNS